MKAADTYSQKPDLASAAAGSITSGTTLYPKGILDHKSDGRWYVFLSGKEFIFLPQRNEEEVCIFWMENVPPDAERTAPNA